MASLTISEGLFYPRHRLLIWNYEQEIRACGFRGAHPYWDWSLDSGSADDFFNSPVFDTETGFGGNGEFLPLNTSGLSPQFPITDGKVPSVIADRTGGGCIPDGPFANMTIHMGPGLSTAYKAQCVRRDFVPSYFMASGSVEAVSTAMGYVDFGSFTRQTELTVHGAGHIGVGGLYGVLTDAWASRKFSSPVARVERRLIPSTQLVTRSSTSTTPIWTDSGGRGSLRICQRG